MMGEGIGVLLVDGDPEGFRRIATALAGGPTTYDIELVGRLGAALARARCADIDVVLLSLSLPDTPNHETWGRFLTMARVVPVVVLTGPDEHELGEQAVRDGAEEALPKGCRDPMRIRAAISHALARHHRRREEEDLKAEREIRCLERLGLDSVQQPSALRGVSTLRGSDPATFDSLVAQYGVLLVGSAMGHDQLLRVSTSAKLRRMSKLLGELDATPKDVLDIHLETLRRMTDAPPSVIASDLMEEGRLRALELMADLLTYYRVGSGERELG